MKRHAVALAASAVIALAGVGAAGATSVPPDTTPVGTGVEVPDLDGYTIAFAQMGAESGWRTAETDSVKAAAEAAGVELLFTDAQGKQEAQVEAIRAAIQQGVDLIAFPPVINTGWDAVLTEARDAGIPVVLVDRTLETTVEDAYVTFLGSDFVVEGERVGEWANAEFADADTVNVVELAGTTGAGPAIDRAEGFRNAIDDRFEIIESQTGDFTREGGKEVMEAFLQSHPDGIDLVYAHNDDMGLGAIEAIEAAGLVPGEDIKIATVDAVHDGMAALAEGRINFIAECSPLLGPQLMAIAADIFDGVDVPPQVITIESTFTPEQAAEVLDSRQY